MQIINRRVRYDYQILDKVEAGIVLTGAEAKSIRGGRGDISTAFVRIKDAEAFLLNADIPIPQGAPKDYDPKRTRKLLLNKRQIVSLSTRAKQFRLTFVPTKLYTKGRLVKVEVALVKPKKKYEKKQTLKARDLQREAEREIRG